MDETDLMVARAWFLAALAERADLVGLSDDELVAAGNTACDSMDRGDSFQSMLIVTATQMATAQSTDAVAALAGIAVGTLCPEHQDLY